MIEIPSTAAGGEPLGDGAAEDPTRGRSQLLAAGWLQLVLEALTRIYHPDERTLKKLARNAAWMFKYFQRRGITRWCEITGEITLEWCWAGVRGADGAFREASASTARNRQWMAQTTFAAAAHLGAQIRSPHRGGPQDQTTVTCGAGRARHRPRAPQDPRTRRPRRAPVTAVGGRRAVLDWGLGVGSLQGARQGRRPRSENGQVLGAPRAGLHPRRMERPNDRPVPALQPHCGR